MTFSCVWEDVFTASHKADSHRVELIWQTLISPSLSLPFAIPPVDFCICRPTSTLEKQNEDPWNEMPNTALLVTWRRKKKKNLWQRKDKKRRRSRPNYWPWWEVCEFSSPLMGMLIFLQYNMVRHSQSVGTKCGLGPKLHPGGTLPFKKWIGNCCKKSQKNSGCVTNRRQTGCGEGRRRRNPKSIGVGRCQGDQDWWVLPLGL